MAFKTDANIEEVLNRTTGGNEFWHSGCPLQDGGRSSKIVRIQRPRVV